MLPSLLHYDYFAIFLLANVGGKKDLNAPGPSSVQHSLIG